MKRTAEKAVQFKNIETMIKKSEKGLNGIDWVIIAGRAGVMAAKGQYNFFIVKHIAISCIVFIYTRSNTGDADDLEVNCIEFDETVAGDGFAGTFERFLADV